MNRIKSGRLTLIPQTLTQLKLCLTDLPALGRDIDLTIADGVVIKPVRRAIGLKIAKMEPVDPRVR